MFRVIPFKSLSEVTYKGSLTKLYEDTLSKDKILIQDTEDMVIESYTLKELYDFELNEDVSFEGFTLLGGRLTILDGSTDIYNGRFLNDNLITCSTYSSYGMDTFDGIFNGIICAEPYESKFLLKIKYNDFWFKFQLNGYDAENGVLLMSVNEVPVMFLDNSLLSMDVEFDAYFELIQVCKTKTGFELVLHFPQVRGYFGIQLSNKLELIKFVNIEAFADSKLNSKTDFKNFNQQLAKWKLLGGICV